MLAACHTDQMSDNTISAELMDIEFMNNQAYSLAQASACERKSGVLQELNLIHKPSCRTPAIWTSFTFKPSLATFLWQCLFTLSLDGICLLIPDISDVWGL